MMTGGLLPVTVADIGEQSDHGPDDIVLVVQRGEQEVAVDQQQGPVRARAGRGHGREVSHLHLIVFQFSVDKFFFLNIYS